MAQARKQKNVERQEEPAFATLNDKNLVSMLGKLSRIALRPPQTLLLEGGTETQRMDVARYWAAYANCEATLEGKKNGKLLPPCLTCNTCRQIGANEFLDLVIHDGRISNAQDENNPGPVKALNMQRIRELKGTISQPPHGFGKRVVILMGLPINRDNAANALLKALEEPNRDTLFILLSPQRAQLLPTLVSRSFVITLPWPDPMENLSIPYEKEISDFFIDGKSFLDRISLKGSLDSGIASSIVLGIQKLTIHVLAGENCTRLEKIFKKATDPVIASKIVRWLSEAQEMLQYAVNPARVLEGLFTRLFCFLH